MDYKGYDPDEGLVRFPAKKEKPIGRMLLLFAFAIFCFLLFIWPLLADFYGVHL